MTHLTVVPPPTCHCGHVEAAHEHFRPGADCGACGRERCAEFRLAVPIVAAVADPVPEAVPGRTA